MFPREPPDDVARKADLERILVVAAGSCTLGTSKRLLALAQPRGLLSSACVQTTVVAAVSSHNANTKKNEDVVIRTNNCHTNNNTVLIILHYLFHYDILPDCITITE